VISLRKLITLLVGLSHCTLFFDRLYNMSGITRSVYSVDSKESPLRTLYEKIDPFETGFIDVGDGYVCM
jgi:hypothetical protein